MPVHPLLSRDLGFLLFAALTLAPVRDPPVQGSAATDIKRVQAGQCEYRGISASFEELTQAYALEIYEAPRLVRWEARPSPHDPEHEALVTGVFTAGGLKPGTRPPDPQIQEARRQALPSFGVTWRLSKLWAMRISAYNDYAQDALATFQQTIDAFLARMVYVLEPAQLRAGPGAEQAVVAQLEPGTALLQEGQQEGWSQVRIPSTTTSGWLPQDQLRSLGHD